MHNPVFGCIDIGPVVAGTQLVARPCNKALYPSMAVSDDDGESRHKEEIIWLT